MLIEYFTYEELKELKMKVIQKHLEKAEECDWSFHPSLKDDDDEECGEEATCSFFALDDEDADVDESSDSEASDAEADASLQQALREVRIISGLVKHVLKRVGGGVRVCNLAHSRGISSSLVHKILKLCPNLHTLSLAHTRVTDAAFKEYGLKGQVGHLEHLDLTGCENVTDATLHSLTCYSAHCQDPLPASTSGITCPQDGSSTPPVSDHDSVISDRLPSSERLVPIVHPVISLSPPPVSENSGPSHSEFHLSFLESEALIEDPTFTDLSALELCDLDCLARNICNQRSEGENSTRGCCQTRDIFGSKEGKDRNSTGKTPKRLDSGEADVRNVPKTGCCSGGEGCEGADGDGERELSVMSSATLPHSLHGLRFLSLNGCFRVQDSGLRVLSERGGLPSLQHLDLSGCLNLTGAGVARLVEACPTLDHAHLFYCDNLFPDPFPTTASGCRNLQCTTRICCRSGD
nr:hypothetical protein BaRGS_026187 [Batillaria attramentaria]